MCDGEEDETASRVGEGLPQGACMGGYPLVKIMLIHIQSITMMFNHENKKLILNTLLVYSINYFF